jgi:NadR type nicotinamide-nucleotide adenylyltransferase
MRPVAPNILKVSIIGADCTGKTDLATSLAMHYGTVWVPEYARRFLIENGGRCSVRDMIHIATSQIMEEERLISSAHRVIFSDGSPLASSVWSLRYFREIECSLQSLAQSHSYDLYLLTDIDLPWAPDGLRDSRELRAWLHSEFEAVLTRYGCRFRLVQGHGHERTESAIAAVDLLLSSRDISG